MRPLFMALVLILAGAFCTATVFANRFYQSKQQHLGEMWFARGQAALAAGQAGPAIQDFRNALYYSHDDPVYRLRLAEALLAADDTREAQSYLLTLWQDEPSNSTINLQLARLSAKQGQTQAALRYYHGAIYGLWPDGEAAARRQRTRLELVRYLLDLQDTTQADSELIALTPELPRSPAAHSDVGRLFLQTNDDERALQAFQEALRLNREDVPALQGAGEAAFQLARFPEASQYLERAVRGGRHEARAEELLATSRLVLEWNPYAKGLSAKQRAVRMVQAFRQASRRLGQCAAERGLAPASGPTPELPPAAAAAANPANAAAPQNAASGLVARILGRIKPRADAQSPANPPASNVTAAAMQPLQQQITQVRRSVRTYNLERDPQLADLVMGLVAQVETITAQQCSPPQGPDLALLLLAHQAEEQ